MAQSPESFVRSPTAGTVATLATPSARLGPIEGHLGGWRCLHRRFGRDPGRPSGCLPVLALIVLFAVLPSMLLLGLQLAIPLTSFRSENWGNYPLFATSSGIIVTIGMFVSRLRMTPRPLGFPRLYAQTVFGLIIIALIFAWAVPLAADAFPNQFALSFVPLAGIGQIALVDSFMSLRDFRAREKKVVERANRRLPAAAVTSPTAAQIEQELESIPVAPDVPAPGGLVAYIQAHVAEVKEVLHEPLFHAYIMGELT